MQTKMNKIIILLSLILCKSYAQLTSPGEAVCDGEQVVFTCYQAAFSSTWTVGNLPSGAMSLTVNFFLAGTVLTFPNDTGFGFEIHVLSSGSASSNSELRVTAVRQLNGVTVECSGYGGSYMSTIQIASVDLAAPSGVMTTLSTASITLTWSASSEADNYTIMVTPLLPSGQSLVSATTTSLQLTVLYNEEYSINITAQNTCGSNSTILPLTVGSDSSGNSGTVTLSKRSQVIIAVTAISCSLVFLILGMFLGCLIHHCFVRSSSPAPPTASAPVVYEEVSPDSHSDRKRNDIIELDENVAYEPVTK